VLFTTTSSLEGWTISEYLGSISAHAVIGTGLISDLSAVWSDLSGGYSQAYGGKLDRLEGTVLQQLRDKARFLQANAVIGMRIDFDSIDAGGKSMLMVTARGTAVRAKSNDAARRESSTPQGVFTAEDLANRVQRMRLVEQANQGKLDLVESVAFLIDQRVDELAPWVLQNAQSSISAEQLDRYFSVIPVESAKQAVYDVLGKGRQAPGFSNALGLLARLKLFDPESTMRLLASEDLGVRWVGMNTLFADQSHYSADDLPRYQKLLAAVKAAPFPEAEIVVVKKMMGTKDTWNCSFCGSKEQVERECGNCGADRRGFRGKDISPEKGSVEINARIAGLTMLLAPQP